MKKTFIAAAVFLLICIVTAPAFAGGPLATMDGRPVRFQSDTISYTLDRGSFGIFTNQQAKDLAVESFQTWSDVASSAVTFRHTDADTLPVDVNGSNFLDYTTMSDVKVDGINPIVFDSDGSITDALFGDSASASIIGFAWAEDVDGDGFFDEGEAFMNGKLADGTSNSYTLAEWKSTFVHEFGHMLGLDHTQINGEFAYDPLKTIYIPTMFPTATANDVPLGELNPDDIAAISLLYPEPAFAASTGSISGSAVRNGGTPVQGANIIAVSTGADSLMNQISTITDYYELGTGDFSIAGLTPGTYYVRMEPVNPEFTEGSSVGPFSYDAGGESFVDPVMPEYYNGAGESSDTTTDHPAARSSVTVAAGDTTGGINFVANSVQSPGNHLFGESFTGSAGTPLTNAGWTLSGTSNVNAISIVSPGLSFSGYSFPGTGNAALLRTNGQDLFNSFETISNGVVYLSFLINADSAKTGDYFIALSPSSGQTNYYARIHVKSSGAGYVLGVNKQNEVTGGSMYGTTVLNFKTTYCAVLKYEFISASTTNDKMSLFIFDSAFPSIEPNTKEIDSYTNAKTDPADFGFVTLRQGTLASAGQLVIDEIIIGPAWPSTVTAVDQHEPSLPKTLALEQNYPNPFNPSTVINYQLPMNSFVTLKVYDIIGKEAATLVNSEQSAGNYSVTFNGSGLSSGIYFYQIRTAEHTITKKMILMK